MPCKKRRNSLYRLLSIVISVALVVTLLTPRSYASAAIVPAFAKTSQSILVGDSYTLAMKNKIADAKYTWKSSDKTVATVSSKGVVKGIKKGSAVISCNVKTAKQTYTLKCTVTVKKPATEVAISNKIDYLLVGESYDLNRKLTPSSANEAVTWSSSDKSVLSIDKKGLIKAQKKGVAKITLTTSSKKTDEVTIYVVEEKSKIITRSDVVGGKVTLENKSYGDLTITSSVGDAQITLNNITVGGTLTMESGAAYTVVTKDSTINKVAAIEQMDIQSFAVGDASAVESLTPSIVAESGSLIVSIDSECNIMVKQTNGATIQNFSLVTNKDGSISISLEGFRGNIVIDSQSSASIQIAATACEIASATIRNATEGQAISLTDTKAGTEEASIIQSVIVAANAALTVGVKAEEVRITGEVSQAEVTISQQVTIVSNEGSQTSLVINSQVRELNVTGSGTSVSLNNGAVVNTITTTADNTTIVASEGSEIKRVEAHGDHTSLEGKGKINEAVVTGSNSSIGTAVDNVQVAKGTSNVTVGGVEVKEEDKVEIAKPTLTPVPSATPKPSATPSPKVTPGPSATPVPPTPIPVVVPPVNPIITPTPKPTATPTPTPTVAPPSDQEKLEDYNHVLTNLYDATVALMADNSQSNKTTVKNTLNEVKNKLVLYQDIESAVSNVVLNDNYIEDFAHYYEYLATEADGSEIRIYYVNKTLGSETLAQAIGCANRVFKAINRINTEKPMLEEDITALFRSLDGSAQEFYNAISKYFSDYGDTIRFELKDAETIKQIVRMNLIVNDNVWNNYQLGSNRQLYFLQDIILYNDLEYICDKAMDLFNNKDKYKTLIDTVIEKMPKIKIWKWADDVTHEISFDRVEYEPLDAEGEAALHQAVQALFDQVDLYYFVGSNNFDGFVVDPDLTELLVSNFAYLMGNFEYKDGNVVISFHDYVYNYDTLSEIEKIQGIRDVMHHMVWSPINNQRWSEKYLLNYQSSADAIITAANADNAGLLYDKISALYQKKLEDNDSKAEWADYTQPSNDMDKELLLQLIKQKLQPGSERKNNLPANSRLYIYNNAARKTGYLLDQAIFELMDMVTVCQATKLEASVEQFFELLPEGRWVNQADPENAYVVFDMPEDPTPFSNAIQVIFDQASSLRLIHSDRRDFQVDDSYAYILVDRFINHILRQEDWNYPGGISKYYNDYYNNSNGDPADRARVRYNCIEEITGITYDTAGWNDWFLSEYKDYADQTVDAASKNDADAAYEALVASFEKRLSNDSGYQEDWSADECKPAPSIEDDTVLKEMYLSIVKRWINENNDTSISQYAAGSTAIHAYLVDGVIWDIREMYIELLRVSKVIEHKGTLDTLLAAIQTYNMLMNQESPDDSAIDQAAEEALLALTDLFDKAGALFNDEFSGFNLSPDYITSYIANLTWHMTEAEGSNLYTYVSNSDPDILLIGNTINDVLWSTYDIHHWNDRVIDQYGPIVGDMIQIVDTNEGTDADELLSMLLALYHQLEKDDNYLDLFHEWTEPAEEYKSMYLSMLQSRLQDENSGLAVQRDGRDTTAMSIDRSLHELKDIVRDAENLIGYKEDVIELFRTLDGTDEATLADFQTIMNKIVYECGEYGGFTENADYYQALVKYFALRDEQLRVAYEQYLADPDAFELDHLTARDYYGSINYHYGEAAYVINHVGDFEELVNAFLDTLPEMTLVSDPMNPDNTYVEYIAPADSSDFIQAIQNIFDGDILQLYGDELKNITVDSSIADNLFGCYAHHIMRDEVWNAPGGLGLYYEGFYKNSGEDQILKLKLLYNAINEITHIYLGAEEWRDYTLPTYQPLLEALLAAVQADDSEGAYNALIDVYKARLAHDNWREEWEMYGPIPNEEDDLAIKMEFLQKIKNWLENTELSISRYHLGETVTAGLVEGATYDMRQAYWEVIN